MTSDATEHERPFQFSLRQLLITVTAINVAVALIVWQPFWGSFGTLIGLSLLLIVAGFKTRRNVLVLCGLALLIGGGVLFVRNALTAVAWQGSMPLDVYVLVIDTDTFQPVPEARIEVLCGPFSPLEGVVSPYLMDTFTPAPMEPDVGPLITDSGGRCKFAHRFFAAGTDSVFGDSAYIRTYDTWLRVSAEGRGAVMLPIDGQSGRCRNFDDTTPVFVTIPLRTQPKGS